MKKYNRYELLSNKDRMLPFINFTVSTNDKYIKWNSNSDRYDKISYKYYGGVEYSFLLYYANPEYLSEWDIPNNTLIRIPYPLERVLNEYETIVNNMK